MQRLWVIVLIVASAGQYACKSYDLPPSAAAFQPCCGAAGTCIPAGLVPEKVRGRLDSDTCQVPQVCVPSAFAAHADFVAQTCRAGGRAEGRCMPSCLPDVRARADRLAPDGCAPQELCVPCYDPRTGEDTEICHLGSDPGPKEPAYVFGQCCKDQGRCVSQAQVASSASGTDLSQLGSRDCAEANTLCVAEAWLDHAPSLSACRSIGGFEGRCVPECIIQVSNQEALPRAGCSEHELCAPCYDPRTGKDSGACRLQGDQPKEPAQKFAECCTTGAREPQGRCVPRELAQTMAQDADLKRLGRDTCTTRDALCVPMQWLDDPEFVPAECRAGGGFEGRCLPGCLPDVAMRADTLLRSSCDMGLLCVPCFDPIDGEDTGACSQGGDAPRQPATTFENCCGSGSTTAGRCVTRDLLDATKSVASADLERLGRDSCPDSQALCVPNEWLEQEQPALSSCRSVGGFEGRCLPSCLPDVAKQADRLQPDSCPANDLCVPCFDPVTAMDTGACHLGNDKPTTAAQSFSMCCGSGDQSRGRCVPRASLLQQSVSETDLQAFGPDSCSASDTLCVPTAWLAPEPPRAATCRAPGDLEGRCLPDCLPNIVALAKRLSGKGCSEHELCAPCYDPQTEQETGVCTINGDKPSEAARGFARCCGTGATAQGTCVPSEFLSSGEMELQVESCRSYDARCVPTKMFKDPTTKLTSCTSVLGSRGLCFGQCYLGSTASVLSQQECVPDERCVPCAFMPITGVGCE